LQQEQEKRDYTALLDLFQSDLFTLTDGLELAEGICQQLEEIIDDALVNTLAALPAGAAIEMLNRDDALAQRLPLVHLRRGNGVVELYAVHLRLLSFQEVRERLANEAEAFKLFLMTREVLNWRNYLSTLWLWERVDPSIIINFRIWLKGYYAQASHPAKLQAIAMYCRLAHMDGFLSAQEVEAITDAMNKPLPRKRRQ
jgi:hypothetical protein